MGVPSSFPGVLVYPGQKKRFSFLTVDMRLVPSTLSRVLASFGQLKRPSSATAENWGVPSSLLMAPTFPGLLKQYFSITMLLWEVRMLLRFKTNPRYSGLELHRLSTTQQTRPAVPYQLQATLAHIGEQNSHLLTGAPVNMEVCPVFPTTPTYTGRQKLPL